MYQGLIISFVVAYAKNRIMGVNNQLPWHLPDDLQHFKKLTLNKPLLMGRKTYQSIGRPLPNRRNIVLTREQGLQIPGCEVINHIDQLAQILPSGTEVMIAGGADIFRLMLPYADTLHVTEIKVNMEGDTYFPSLDMPHWQESERMNHPVDEKHQYPFDFVTYQRQES